ncbi:TetR/AcrR family transcriptional regulator [Noviherbaspirillum sp.]|jgi:AcrR family transcriptional regulator|uniref:TetR/AcrR family transcriptional regulator n=1 Tax=Noviherbaspirillum sp. TaxID=1926288 RepID=UPI0025CE4D9A|nr:TetR/AcrR family transcriptional regulator [Noviherbaspirillum sp.]
MRARTKEPTPDAVKKEGKVRQRLSTQEREQQILQGAIKFFSERGLEGQTRDLAKDIGITHPLLYHYFPTKQALIDRVYQEVYLGRWKREWETWLDEKDTGLEEKLARFYLDYAATILTPEWVRILVFSGLNDGSIPDKYLGLLKQKLFPRIVTETRKHLGLPLRGKITERENEHAWGLHGGIFYIGIRQWVYNLPGPENLTEVIQDRVHAYIVAAQEMFGGDK